MAGLRHVLRYARACAFAWSGAGRRARGRLDGSRAALLMYHRVVPATDAARNAVEPGMFVTPETFERHLAWLTDSFSVLPLHEITTRLADDLPLPPRACAITFDDGWRDNYDFALPALALRPTPLAQLAEAGVAVGLGIAASRYFASAAAHAGRER